MARDWSTFTRRISIHHPNRAIYQAWAVPSQIERWFLRSAEYLSSDGTPRNRDREVEAGDAYTWGWHGFPDDAAEGGTIIEANGHDRFSFTFTEDCIVTVVIKGEPGETILELTQSQIPEDENRGIYIECSYGWTFYLANLKSILEGGIDLRNKNVDIQNVVNS